jgi:hypothetical protein
MLLVKFSRVESLMSLAWFSILEIADFLVLSFIATNAYGGMSCGGYKLPTLYAIMWLPVNDFVNLEKNKYRYTHLAIDREPLKYFIKGANPKYKNTEQKKKQYKKDLKTPNVE